ncbi:MAG TPA: response regulator [Labilithrix sp.]|nr:response regulator [Labilithrix sp.]
MSEPSLSFLVVEDEAGVRRMLGRGLASHGQVETVGTCAAARMSLRVRQYDALVVDVHLPDGSGLDLVAVAMAKSPNIVVLVLTGSTDHEIIGRVHQVGARYLLKPFDASHLATLAHEVRGRQAAGERRVQLTLERWAKDLDLSDTEVELLALGARGLPRDKFATQRGVRPDTIRKQIQALLQKTGDDTFEGAVNSLLREAVSEPT